MAKSIQNLRKKLPPERQRRIDARTRQLHAELPLQKIRKVRHLSQEEVAKVLQVKQGTVSKLERRTDVYISTLRKYIEAMGGTLTIRAEFPEGPVDIVSLGGIEPRATPR
ncbi:MAG: XRE family transcriptional regulator [Lysobacterales bacterium]|jgi:DNA-binding transcriptional regulator YiaG